MNDFVGSRTHAPDSVVAGSASSEIVTTDSGPRFRFVHTRLTSWDIERLLLSVTFSAAVTATCTAQVDQAFDRDALTVTLDGVELTECTSDHCESGFTVDEEYGNIRIEGLDCLSLLDGECHDLRFAEVP